MAEIEIGVMSRHCLARRIPALETMKNEAAAWGRNRNAARKTVHWQFTTPNARLKLQRLPNITLIYIFTSKRHETA
jgi:hypothetical protein